MELGLQRGFPNFAQCPGVRVGRRLGAVRFECVSTAQGLEVALIVKRFGTVAKMTSLSRGQG